MSACAPMRDVSVSLTLPSTGKTSVRNRDAVHAVVAQVVAAVAQGHRSYQAWNGKEKLYTVSRCCFIYQIRIQGPPRYSEVHTTFRTAPGKGQIGATAWLADGAGARTRLWSFLLARGRRG